MYDGGYGPTNVKLSRYLDCLFRDPDKGSVVHLLFPPWLWRQGLCPSPFRGLTSLACQADFSRLTPRKIWAHGLAGAPGAILRAHRPWRQGGAMLFTRGCALALRAFTPTGFVAPFCLQKVGASPGAPVRSAIVCTHHPRLGGASAPPRDAALGCAPWDAAPGGLPGDRPPRVDLVRIG